MNAIPTKYAGVQFRSRLEAKWAAFFDLVAWDWHYEPIDAPGWIPDFYVRPGYGSDWLINNRIPDAGWLVEVKPAFSISDFELERYRSLLGCCEIAGYEGIALLGATVSAWHLGAKRFAPDLDLLAGQIGWFLPAARTLRAFPETLPEELPRREIGPGYAQPLFLHANAEFHEVDAFWSDASNRVQWKSPR